MKTLLLVADSLNFESVNDFSVPLVKDINANGPFTPIGTFSLLFGRPISHLFWPTINYNDILGKYPSIPLYVINEIAKLLYRNR